MTDKGKPGFFYGYVVVAAGLITQLLMLGSFFTFGIFLKPLSSELGWTRATTSGAFSLAFFLFGFLSIASGRLTDKYGPRIVIIICGVLLGSGFLLTSQISEIWQYYLFHGVFIGVAMSAVDVPILSTVARWFIKKRGMAIGITKTGAGLGIMVMPILANWLIDSYGWRNAYIIIAIGVMVLVVLLGLLFHRDPEKKGQLPDGRTEPEELAISIDPRQFSLSEALGISQFWLFSVIWFLIYFCLAIFVSHLAPHVTDLGISSTVAASVLGAVGGFSVVGRLGTGSLCDRLGIKRMLFIALTLLAISLVWLLFARQAWQFYVFTVIYGIAHGGFNTLFSPMAAELFGLKSLGAILGTAFAIVNVGTAASPFLAGYIFDITGSYQLIFLTCLALSFVTVILLFFLKPVDIEAPEGARAII